MDCKEGEIVAVAKSREKYNKSTYSDLFYVQAHFKEISKERCS
jgi:hypothetical protein